MNFIFFSCFISIHTHTHTHTHTHAVVWSPVCFQLFVIPWTAAHQVSLSIISRSLLRLMSIELVMLSNHFILFCPLLLLPSVFSSIRVFSNQSVLHIRWPKYWNFSFSITPDEYSRLISFRTGRFDLFAVQGTLKSLLQHHSLKASIIQCLAIYIYICHKNKKMFL